MVNYVHTMQGLENDCGVAIVQTIFKQHRIQFNYQQLFSEKTANTEGYSLFDIQSVLKEYGVESTAYQVDDFSEILNMNHEFILVVNQEGLNHYIYCYGKKGNKLVVSNPSKPEIEKLTIANIEQIFEGYIISIDSVKKRKTTSKHKEKKNELYRKIIKYIPKKMITEAFLLTIIQFIAPLAVTLIIQTLFSSDFEEVHSGTEIFYILCFVFFLIASFLLNLRDTKLKIQIDNIVQKKIISDYYDANSENYDAKDNLNNIVGYLDNLIGATRGLLLRLFLIFDLVYFIFLMIFLLKINFLFPLIFSLLFVVYIIFIRVVLPKLANNERYLVTKNVQLTSVFEEQIRASQDIMVNCKEVEAKKNLEAKIEEFFLAKYKEGVLDSKVMSLIYNLSMVMIVTITVISYLYVLQNKNIFTVTSGIYVFFIITNNFVNIGSNWIAYKKSEFSANYITEIKNIDLGRTKKELVDLEISHLAKVEMSNIAFSYEAENNLLQSVCLQMNAGQSTGIKGKNGSGKTTITKLLMGIYTPSQGTFKLNDHIKLDSLVDTNILKYISLYSPEQHLFYGSVYMNIVLNLVKSNEKKEIERFFSNSLATNKLIHSNGANISVGQQQKILLERCLNKEADIYIFDEPSGNLEEESKQKLQTIIKELKQQQKIVIIISHDSELLEICDNQYIL